MGRVFRPRGQELERENGKVVAKGELKAASFMVAFFQPSANSSTARSLRVKLSTTDRRTRGRSNQGDQLHSIQSQLCTE